MLLNMNVVQRKKLTIWQQCQYLQRLVAQDINNDPKGIRLYKRIYFGRLLVLGGFRYVNSLRPVAKTMKEMQDENLKTVQRVNLALSERPDYKVINYLAYDFNFVLPLHDTPLSKTELFFIESLEEQFKTEQKANEIDLFISILITLGAMFNIEYGAYQFNHDYEKEQDKIRTYQLANQYINEVAGFQDFELFNGQLIDQE